MEVGRKIGIYSIVIKLSGQRVIQLGALCV